jgi:serine-type D-Ala-D-Ala carboxypeptidase
MTDTVSAFLKERIDAGDFPSAVYLVGQGDEVILSGALGNAVTEPQVIGASQQTIYDLASLTKPLVTGLLTALFIERGMISLDHKISAHLPEFDIDGKRMITVGDLVSHSSHLPAWIPFYLLTDDPANILREIADLKVEFGNEAVVYGDPNFIVLGILLERLSGLSIDRLSEDEIFEPLGLKHTFFNPPHELKPRIAANEFGNEFERQMCLEKGYSEAETYAFREEIIWGEVHDGNAHFMNGAAGHAGAFSTASEIFAIAQQFLPATSALLQQETCSLFITDLTPGANEARSLGFQLAGTPASTAGEGLSPQSFGHVGFTGTSLWIDPASERTYILLTNRTHRREPPFANINATRRRFNELAAAISA